MSKLCKIEIIVERETDNQNIENYFRRMVIDAFQKGSDAKIKVEDLKC